MSWRDTEYEDLHRIVMPADAAISDIRSAMPDTEEARVLLREKES